MLSNSVICNNCRWDATTVDRGINFKCPRCGSGLFTEFTNRNDIAPNFKGGKTGQAGKESIVVSGKPLQS